MKNNYLYNKNGMMTKEYILLKKEYLKKSFSNNDLIFKVLNENDLEICSMKNMRNPFIIPVFRIK